MLCYSNQTKNDTYTHGDCVPNVEKLTSINSPGGSWINQDDVTPLT